MSTQNRYEYVITSERAHRRSDEERVSFYSNAQYKVGEIIELDGLKWIVEEAPDFSIPEKRIWSEQEIKDLIQTNDKVLYGALKKLYAEQTADEQRAHETRNRNNAGFNSVDAKFLSSVAEFLIKTGFLTDKQKVITRRKLVKYNKQLTRLANG